MQRAWNRRNRTSIGRTSPGSNPGLFLLLGWNTEGRFGRPHLSGSLSSPPLRHLALRLASPREGKAAPLTLAG